MGYIELLSFAIFWCAVVVLYCSWAFFLIFFSGGLIIMWAVDCIWFFFLFSGCSLFSVGVWGNILLDWLCFVRPFFSLAC